MSEPIYFQWQNEFLRRTIYPLREMKLRDFLVYYYEIDLWADYKNKTVADVAPEVQTYLDAQKRMWEEAYATFRTLWDYFVKKNVSADPRVNNLHELFAKYFPTYNNPRKERYFLTARVGEFEQLRKNLERELANKRRILRNMEQTPNWPRRDDYIGQINTLENVAIKTVDEELTRLYDFLAAFARLEKRRADLQAWKSKQAKLRAELEGRLKRLKTEAGNVENQYNQAVSAANKLRNPPAYEHRMAYFLKQDVSEEYSHIPNLDGYFMGQINLAHKQFEKFPPTKDKQKIFIDNLIRTYKPRWLTFKGVALQMAQTELGKLQDFYDAIDIENKTPEQKNSLITQADARRQGLEGQLRAKQAEVKTLEDQVRAIMEAAGMDEKEQLAAYTSAQEVSVRDIVRGKVEAYQNKLAQLDERQLLEEMLGRFEARPERYPPWLQYMVIHFSGMRYQSAHGSWADPRDLLEALTEKAVEAELRRANDLAIEALCQEKIACYEQARSRPVNQAPKEGECDPPRLVLSQKPKWVAKVKRHLESLRSLNLRVKVTPAEGKPTAVLYRDQPGAPPVASGADTLRKEAEITVDPAPLSRDRQYYRIVSSPSIPKVAGLYIPVEEVSIIPDARKRKALLDLRIDEETYAIEEELKDEQVLEQLGDLKEQLELPSWMWNEIVRLTDLRLKEVKSESWEKLSDKELEDRQSYQWREYRQVMDNWKKANLTGWREEHDRANRLIVTRAVCNEVAEHIQHLRGHAPPGGLTAKPEWYLRKERDPKLAGVADKPSFVKPKSAQDLKPGASILWLRFVEGEPNAWRIAHPLTLKDGSGLLTPGLNIVQGDNEAALGRISINPRPNTTSEWVYHQDGRGRYKRSRYVYDQNNVRRAETQWLRWMHEATVVEVGETADGTVVLTYETALPYEDKRRSTIGVFKHSLGELLYNVSPGTFNGTFAGYVPQGELPQADLQEMLDRDKILQRKAIPQPAPAPARPALPGEQVEVAPPVEVVNHKERIVCYEVDALKKTAKPYSPSATLNLTVELPRGVRLRVSKSAPVTMGTDSYYPVILCEWDPRAQDLYVRAAEVVDAPEDGSSIPVAAKGKLALKTIAKGGVGGAPVMVDAKSTETGQVLQLAGGTKLRVSAVHRLPGAAQEKGLVKGEGGQTYYLIVECPSRSSAVGAFVEASEVQKIEEADYGLGAAESAGQSMQKLRVKVAPAGGQSSISLTRKTASGASEVVAGDSLARDAELLLDSRLEFQPGQEFYRILEYPANPKIAGLYVNARDVILVSELAAR